MNPFETLIHELGGQMGAILHPDSHQSCLIHFTRFNINVQIDLDSSGDQILIGCELGDVPLGAFRERVFLQALRVNGLTDGPRGTLAFSEKKNQLILFYYLSLSTTSGVKLYNFLKIFTEHAQAWRVALERGELPTIEEPT